MAERQEVIKIHDWMATVCEQTLPKKMYSQKWWNRGGFDPDLEDAGVHIHFFKVTAS